MPNLRSLTVRACVQMESKRLRTLLRHRVIELKLQICKMIMWVAGKQIEHTTDSTLNNSALAKVSIEAANLRDTTDHMLQLVQANESNMVARNMPNPIVKTVAVPDFCIVTAVAKLKKLQEDGLGSICGACRLMIQI